jgi:hypothetical protein
MNILAKKILCFNLKQSEFFYVALRHLKENAKLTNKLNYLLLSIIPSTLNNCNTACIADT